MVCQQCLQQLEAAQRPAQLCGICSLLGGLLCQEAQDFSLPRGRSIKAPLCLLENLCGLPNNPEDVMGQLPLRREPVEVLRVL